MHNRAEGMRWRQVMSEVEREEVGALLVRGLPKALLCALHLT